MTSKPKSEAREDTKTRLLEAAEQILIEEGVNALTMRRIGTVSAVNPTLITYHFGTVAGLLAELCKANLKPMLAEWATLRADDGRLRTLRDVLYAWLKPLIRTAAFTADGRSVTVFDEIASHGNAEIRTELLDAMIATSATVQSLLQAHCTHLGARELRARLRFIAAATLGPPPRAKPPVEPGEEPIDSIEYLVALAEGALLGPAFSRRAGTGRRKGSAALQTVEDHSDTPPLP